MRNSYTDTKEEVAVVDKDLIKSKMGRPKGAKGAKTILRELLVAKSESRLLKDLHKVVDVVVQKATEGDLVAAKMIFDRFFPVVKQQDGSGKEEKSVINIIVGSATATDMSSIKVATKKNGKVVDGEFRDVA